MDAGDLEPEHVSVKIPIPSQRKILPPLARLTASVAQVEDAKYLATGRTPAHALLEFCGVTMFFGLAATTAKRVYDRFVNDGASSTTVCRVGVALVLGILAADLVSGIVHWAADNWGSSSLPGVGAAFIRPFRHHHIDPHAITRHGFLELNGNNFIVSLPLLWAAASAITSPDGASSLASASFWLSFALFCGLTNQVHSWAHMKNPPRLVRGLQDSGLLLSRQHHHLHHIRPHDCNYCITTGWMNRPLTAIGFFEGVERAITAATGTVPLHKHLRKD
jgi:hypothetical protein